MSHVHVPPCGRHALSMRVHHILFQLIAGATKFCDGCAPMNLRHWHLHSFISIRTIMYLLAVVEEYSRFPFGFAYPDVSVSCQFRVFHSFSLCLVFPNLFILTGRKLRIQRIKRSSAGSWYFHKTNHLIQPARKWSSRNVQWYPMENNLPYTEIKDSITWTLGNDPS